MHSGQRHSHTHETHDPHHNHDDHACAERHHHSHGHHHGHGGADGHAHGHTHGIVDPSIASTTRGLWAVKWSFTGLAVTALFQVIVVVYSGSVALLADTIHNVGDAATAIPLGIAFMFGQMKPSRRFPYGYGRIEDLAGVLVVLTILFSAIVAGYESIDRFFHPRKVEYLWAVAAASVIGFAGNELVAVFRIRVGREINSVALIADGYHARIDGWTSLAVLFGALGVWLGFPIADPLIGLGITIAILGIVWQSASAVFTRMLDGVEPEHIDEITHAVGHVKLVREVVRLRARWLGHKLCVDLVVALDDALTLPEAHAVAQDVEKELRGHLAYLGPIAVQVAPASAEA